MKRILAVLACVSIFPACGDTTTEENGTEVTKAEGTVYKFVANRLITPAKRTDFAFDLDNDGKPDNQMGNILSLILAQDMEIQPSVDSTVNEGGAILLLEVQSTDAALKTAENVGVTVKLGNQIKAPDVPDFSGNGTFTVDPLLNPATFYGKLSAGRFSSNNPATSKNPVIVSVTFPVAGTNLTLQLNGGHIQFNSAAGKITSGQIHGSIKGTDLMNTIIPAAAKLATEAFVDPKNDPAKVAQSKKMLDVGDGAGGMCTNPDGTKGKPNDNKVDVCEIAQNPLVAGALDPDVKIFDGATYAPGKGSAKDSLSIGLGFEAVGAKF